MLPFKKILCPTDFSEPSYEAIKTSGELAFHFGSELCLLHVVSPVPVVPMGAEPSAFNVSSYEQELEDSSRKSLQEVINQLEWKELRVRLIVLRGIAADEIVRTADEEDVDLIVIATRGLTGLDRLIFGSVAEKVVRLAKRPVLTVTSPANEEEGGNPRLKKGGLPMANVEMNPPDEKLERKKAYQEKIEGQLKEWSARIDALMAKAETSRAELKGTYEKRVQDLQAKQEVVQRKLRELRESGEETWGGLLAGIEKSLSELKDSFDQTFSKFKEKRGEAVKTVSKQKKAYVQKMEAKLKDWGGEIDVLKAKAEKSKAEAKIAYLKQIQEVKKRQESVKKNLRELRGSGDEAWADFKGGVEDAVKDLKRALTRAASRFKKR
jgi:nucleotide-binding universal stress UspA family protein/archaellum component FlaC